MKEDSKITVVWLCSFANQQTIERFANSKMQEYATWINNLIKIFEGRYDLNIHIVAPNVFNNKSLTYTLNNITYHFYPTMWVLPSRVYNKLRINDKTNYLFIKKTVKKVIQRINPDIIHLHGAENPIYSSTILPLLNKYTVLLTIQGFINLDSSNNPVVIKRKKIEKIILERCHNFGVRAEDTCTVVKSFNSNPRFFWHNYPLTKPDILNINLDSVKEYDCVFFARISPENGIDDLLKAISIVQKTKSDIKLIVIGPVGDKYRIYLEDLCKQLSIIENVIIMGFMSTQQLAFQEIVKAKMDVLPTLYDVIPCSMLECMSLGIPVISYAVGGIPELNRNRESVCLVEKNNIQELANKILFLLHNDPKRKQLSENATISIKPHFNNEEIYTDLISIYNELYSEKQEL